MSSSAADKGSALRHILLVGSGSALAQIITVATTPILTRLYPPDSYALWALLMGIIVILGAVATLRFELAVVLPKTHSEGASVLWLSVLLPLLLGIVLVPAIHFFGHILGPLLGIDDLYRWRFWIPWLVVSLAISQAFQSWCTRTGDFKLLSSSAIFLALSTVAAQIAWGLLGDNRSGLIMGTIVGQTLTIGYLALVTARRYGPLLREAFDFRKIAAMARQYQKYPRYMTPYSLAGVIRERLLVFLLNGLAERQVVGLFAFSSRLVNLPVSLVSSAIRPVLFQRASNSPLPDVEKLILGIYQVLINLVTPVWVVFLFTAPKLFAFAFGAHWESAATYAMILSVPAFLQLLANWLDRMTDALNRQEAAFWLEIVFSVSIIATVSLAARGGIAAVNIVALQATILTAYNLYWIYMVFRMGGFQFSALVSLFFSFLGNALTSAVIVYTLKWLLPDLAVFAVFMLGWAVVKLRTSGREFLRMRMAEA